MARVLLVWHGVQANLQSLKPLGVSIVASSLTAQLLLGLKMLRMQPPGDTDLEEVLDVGRAASWSAR